MRRPSLHQCTPLFERVATPIGAFSFVANLMCKSCFGHFAREGRTLASPITERASETMHRGVNLTTAQDHFQSHHRQRLVGFAAGKNKFRNPPRLHRFKNIYSTLRKRNAMLAPALHAVRRHSPDFARKVNFIPPRAKHLPGSCTG